MESDSEAPTVTQHWNFSPSQHWTLVRGLWSGCPRNGHQRHDLAEPRIPYWHLIGLSSLLTPVDKNCPTTEQAPEKHIPGVSVAPPHCTKKLDPRQVTPGIPWIKKQTQEDKHESQTSTGYRARICQRQTKRKQKSKEGEEGKKKGGRGRQGGREEESNPERRLSVFWSFLIFSHSNNNHAMI